MRQGPSNKQVILDVLRGAEANDGWVSGTDLAFAGGGFRFGARIAELRKAGHVIERRPSKRSAVHEYRLVEEMMLQL
jgi:hypothetical protein